MKLSDYYQTVFSKVTQKLQYFSKYVELHTSILTISNYPIFRRTTNNILLHFVAFFHVASLFSTGVENKKVEVDNEKALELTNSTVFHRGRQ